MWAPEPLCTFWRREKSLVPGRIRTSTRAARALVNLVAVTSQIHFLYDVYSYYYRNVLNDNSVCLFRTSVIRTRSLTQQIFELPDLSTIHIDQARSSFHMVVLTSAKCLQAGNKDRGMYKSTHNYMYNCTCVFFCSTRAIKIYQQ